MAEWDAVSDLKRNGSKRESLKMEIDDMKRFMNENELGGSYGKIMRLILDNAEQSQKKSPQVILIDDDDDDADLPGLKEPLKRFHDEEAGGSNLVPKRSRPDLKSKTKKPRKSNKKDQKNKAPEIQIEEDGTSEKNKTLEIRIKIEGQKAAAGDQNGQKKSSQGILIDHDDDDDADLPGLKEPLKRFHDEEAGGSNPVPKRSHPDLKSKTKKPSKSNKKDQKNKLEVQGQEDEKNKTLEIRIKIEGQKAAGTSNPVSKRAAPSQPRPKDKGVSVISDNPEVEILDDDDAENAVFRNDVLKVLRKPFDMEEYDRLKEAIKAGSYLHHHEDLNIVLQSRRKPEKQLAVLRGFFFWLQNLTRKGAFRPWNDRVCLEVVPAHEE